MGQSRHKDKVWVRVDTRTKYGSEKTQGKSMGQSRHKEKVWVKVDTRTKFSESESTKVKRRVRENRRTNGQKEKLGSEKKKIKRRVKVDRRKS